MRKRADDGDITIRQRDRLSNILQKENEKEIPNTKE